MELVDNLDSMREFLVFRLLFFLLLFGLLFRSLVIDVTLFGGDDYSTAFDFLLPFFSEYDLSGCFFPLFLDLEG